MEGKTSFAKKKFQVNCLLVVARNAFALDAKAKAEDLGLQVMDIVSTSEDVAATLAKYPIDIILFDEDLNDIVRFDNLSIGLDRLPPIVLFTNTDSLKNLDNENADTSCVYLRKPIDALELTIAIRKALKNLVQAVKQNSDIKRENHVLYVRSSGKLISIGINDIAYIKAEGNYCTLHLASKRIVLRSSISNVLDALNSSSFVQIHRSYIANVDRADELTISGGMLHLSTEKLPIGRKYKKELMKIKNK